MPPTHLSYQPGCSPSTTPQDLLIRNKNDYPLSSTFRHITFYVISHHRVIHVCQALSLVFVYASFAGRPGNN